MDESKSFGLRFATTVFKAWESVVAAKRGRAPLRHQEPQASITRVFSPDLWARVQRPSAGGGGGQGLPQRVNDGVIPRE